MSKIAILDEGLYFYLTFSVNFFIIRSLFWRNWIINNRVYLLVFKNNI